MAKDLKVGMQLAEEDGFIWDVVEIISRQEKSISVIICSDFSSFEKHWTTKRDGSKGGLVQTFDNLDILNVVI